MTRSFHCNFLGLLLACSSTLCAAEAASLTPAPASDTSEIRLTHSREWTMRAQDSEREYRIFVALPEGPAPENGYATIYVLDGNSMFFTTVEAVRAQARRRDTSHDTHAIVVGIGYPEGQDIGTARAFDLTPDVAEPRSQQKHGGADAFLDFVVNQLKPRIAREFPVDPARQALMGHSFGGLFTVGVLTRQPDAFQTYVGMSSSFWFGNHDLSRRVAEFARDRKSDAKPVRVLLTTGEFEQQTRPRDWAENPELAARRAKDLESRGQSSRARAASQLLAKAPALLVDFHEIAGEDHGSVIPAAIGRGVDFIFNGPASVPPVPDAKQYLALGAEGRYRLRMQVRALPDLHRIPWLNGLKAALKEGLDSEQHMQLHDERQEMDQRFGSRPHERNAD